MKAIVFQKYGSPEFLELVEVEKPIPKDYEVLIKVHAASINEWDWAMLHGVPLVNRLASGLFKPRSLILGADVAGRIESVGMHVKRFKTGDAVFGDLCRKLNVPEYRGGGFAEYVCTHENQLIPKPDSLTFVQAASLPQAGALAVQGLRSSKEIQPRQKVLINGASGGAGTLAVQMAKSAGAEVTGVCSAGKMNMVRSFGADHVIDYTQEDFTRSGQHYDLIVDVKGYHSIFDYKRVLCADGCYIMLGGSSFSTAQVMLLGRLVSRIAHKKLMLLIYTPNKGLDFLIQLIEAGKVKPVVDRTYPLSQTADAFRYYGEGRAKGKVVIVVEQTKNE